MKKSPSPEPQPQPSIESKSSSKGKRVIIPPEQHRSHLLPPTPPLTEEREKIKSGLSQADTDAIERALSALKAHRDSRSLYTTEFSLSPTAYQSLQDQIQSDRVLWGYVEDKIRYDYHPQDALLSIRMPSTTHELSIAPIRDHILQELRKIGQGQGKIAKLAQKIHTRDSSTIRLRSSAEMPVSGRKDPDCQFGYANAKARYPGVVLEVAYAKGRPLWKAAESYIVESHGAIRAVLGIDIAYPDGPAKVSLWRLQDMEDGVSEIVPVVEDQVFLDASEEEISNEDIQIPLGDFAPGAPGLEELDEPLPSIRIPMGMLAQAVKTAKALDAAWSTEDEPQLPYTKTIRKRKRVSEGEQEVAYEEDRRVETKMPRPNAGEEAYRGKNSMSGINRPAYWLRSRRGNDKDEGTT